MTDPRNETIDNSQNSQGKSVLDSLLGWFMADSSSSTSVPTQTPSDNNHTRNNTQQTHVFHKKKNPPDDYGDAHLFPTLPGFTIPVEIRRTPQYGDDQFGIFALEDIPENTKFWKWTPRVTKIHKDDIEQYIREHYHPNDTRGIRRFLRRGFVLPAPYDEHWNSNPTDAGSRMNHSSTPNCGRPRGTLRNIHKGEELTMDYSGNGNPQCTLTSVIPTAF